MNIADSVQETTAGTSTASIVVNGAVAPNRTFAAAVAAGAFAVGAVKIPIRVEDDAGNWLSGMYTLTNATTLTRTAIGASSAAGGDVTLTGSVRKVSVVPNSLWGRNLLAADTRGTDMAALTAAAALSGTNIVEISQGGAATVRTTLSALATFILSGIGAATPTSQLNTFGDSWTVGGGASSSSTWWNVLYAAALGIPLLNKGISGTVLQNRADASGSPRVDNGMSRYVAALITGSSLSTKYAILYGFNDARYTAAPATINVTNFIADYRTMLTAMINAGISPANIRIGSPGYITDVGLTTGSTGFTGQTRAGFEAYVAAVQQVAGEFGVIYVPVYEYMRDNGAGSLISADNIHPNDAGHAKVKAIFENPGLAADTTAPTATSASVANATPTIVSITMSEAIDPAFIPDISAFTVTGHTVASVAIVGGSFNMTCTAAFTNGEPARTASYTQPGSNQLRDTSGNFVASFSGLAITNNVAAADVTAPAPVSAVVSNSAPTKVVITFSEPLSTSFSPAISAYPVSGHTVSAAAVVGSTVELTVDAFVNGEAARTVGYTQPGSNQLRDVAGNLAATFSGLSITNNVAAASYPRVNAGFTAMTESGSGPYTYSGDGTGTASASVIGGILNQSRPSSTDASFSVRIVSGASGKSPIMGVQTGTTRIATTAMPQAFYVSSGSNTYVAISTGVAQTVANTITRAANDLMRLRISGTSLVAEVSKNSGSTWTTIYTWTGLTTSQLYLSLALTGDAVADQLTAVGLT